MRDFLNAGVRRFASTWFFWAVVLLALPNCALEHRVTGTPPHLITGDLPHSSAIMCDIEKFQSPARRCATAEDLTIGIPLAMAAEALVSGWSSAVGLDFSAAAETACGTGHPQAVDFQGPFPEGLPICLNCGVIPTRHATATAVCIARCRDIVEQSPAPRPTDIEAFCTANARPSTNPPMSGCYDNACSSGGTLRTNFADPRQIPPPVRWRDLIGTADAGSNLTRTAPTTGPGTDDLNAGAVSTQWIEAKDGYVEFEASENNLSHVAGLSQVSGACPFPCTDSDPGIMNINFAISLNVDGRFYVLENGALITGPDVNGSFGTYVNGERFRVKVHERIDGTATVTYSRIVGPCMHGNPCNEMAFYTHLGSPAVYPLRVDTSFREQGATLANVSIVRIQ